MSTSFFEVLRIHYPGCRAALRRPVTWPFLMVALYVFLAPNVDFAPALSWHDGQRIVQLAVISLLVLVLTLSSAKTAFAEVWVALPLWGRRVLAMVFLLGAVSALLAPLPRWAMLEWGMSLLLLTTALAVAAARRTLGEQLDIMLVLLFFSTALAYTVTTCSVYLVMLLIGTAYGQGFDMRELYTGFSNIRFFGHVQTMLLPFLLLPAMYWGTTPVRRILLCGVPAIWWLLAIGSGTRGTWVALLAGVFAALLIGGRNARRWAVWQAVGVICGMVCYGLFVMGVQQLFEQPASLLHRTSEIVSLSRRDMLWSSAWKLIIDHPIFGVGPMHYAYWAKEVAPHPHNAVLQWLAEWGVPAGVLLIGLWVASGTALAGYLKRTIVQHGNRPQFFRIALLAALTGASAQAMVDGILVMPVSQMLLVLLAGWSIGLTLDGKVVSASTVMERSLLILVVLLASVAVVFGAIQGIGDLASLQAADPYGQNPNVILLPRFWARGWITP